MYYDKVNKMSDAMANAYDWEEIDGKPRYRWYKHARESVYLIQARDEHHDITDQSCSDFKYYYDCMNWVVQNDPEALVYMMSIQLKPVNEIVKTKLIENLEALKYYEACEIVKKYLASYPVPESRILERKKDKILETLKSLLGTLTHVSNLLNKFRDENRNDYYIEDLKDAYGYLLNIKSRAYGNVEEEIKALAWLYENDRSELKQQLSDKICKEIKDQLIGLFAKHEKYELCAFIEQAIEIHDYTDYINIPPYNPNFRSPLSDKLSSLFGEDDDDDY